MKKVMILVLLTIILFSGCSQQDNLKLGVVGTLSGFGSFYGQQELRGVELAVDEINAEGGINNKKIELTVEDSASNPTTSVSVIQKLINVDKTSFVIGDSWTSTTVNMFPITNENKVILISPIASLDELSEDDFYFRTVPTIRDMMKPLAEYEIGRAHV